MGCSCAGGAMGSQRSLLLAAIRVRRPVRVVAMADGDDARVDAWTGRGVGRRWSGARLRMRLLSDSPSSRLGVNAHAHSAQQLDSSQKACPWPPSPHPAPLPPLPPPPPPPSLPLSPQPCARTGGQRPPYHPSTSRFEPCPSARSHNSPPPLNLRRQTQPLSPAFSFPLLRPSLPARSAPPAIRSVKVMPRGIHLQPLELVPEWLTDSPITADDLRCTTPASTIFRMSFGMSSAHHPKSTFSIRSSEDDDDDDGESDTSTFLWDDDSDTEDDADTISEPDPAPVVRTQQSPAQPPSPAPVAAHLRAPSVERAERTPAAQARPLDVRSPWFMQVDPACLSALDNQLLQAPLDSFADLCYAQAVHAADARAAPAQAGPRYGYSWRRLSRLRSACPDPSQAALALDRPQSRAGARSGAERESESESDTDSEQLASPEQAAAPAWACCVYPPERQHAESPYRPYAAQTPIIAKPLPAIPPERAQQLSFLFLSPPPPRPGESVHCFPTTRERPRQQRQNQKQQKQRQNQKKAWSRRGTLRISSAVDGDDGDGDDGEGEWEGKGGKGGGGGASPWSPRPGFFQRGLAGIRAGLGHAN
ncbi:hypothetical protein BC628DRAFT_150161 [Trametes gibbosa]|nr:hypothetical protein BC628DRAFT_150161 [Trametes gibbosa]